MNINALKDNFKEILIGNTQYCSDEKIIAIAHDIVRICHTPREDIDRFYLQLARNVIRDSGINVSFYPEIRRVK